MDLNVADAVKLAASLFQDGNYEQAEQIFKAAATADPDNSYAAHGVGMTLMELDKPKEALEWYDRAFVTMRNDMVALTLNRTRALADAGSLPEALALVQQLLRGEPYNPMYRFQRGLVLMQMRRYAECVADMEAVLKAVPDDEKALFARGFARLAMGEYEEGFKDYEHRLKHYLEPINKPEWTGEQDINGKTVLVHADMGLGDNIMFMRYVPELIARGATPVVVVDENVKPLVPEGVAVYSEDRSTWPPFDYWVRFMSLAACFGTSRDTVPPPVEVRVDPARQQAARKLVGDAPSLKVGLCWAGNTKSKYDAWRTIPLAQLAVLFSVPNVTYYSLQKELREGDVDAFEHLKPVALGSTFETYADTVAAMRELDLVITVDTSVAHMAGTVGVPTWVMLSNYRSYWVWVDGLKSSPWYPSVTVFRQESDHNWASIVEPIRARLTSMSSKLALTG